MTFKTIAKMLNDLREKLSKLKQCTSVILGLLTVKACYKSAYYKI